jgi:hypothetical protein
VQLAFQPQQEHFRAVADHQAVLVVLQQVAAGKQMAAQAVAGLTVTAAVAGVEPVTDLGLRVLVQVAAETAALVQMAQMAQQIKAVVVVVLETVTQQAEQVAQVVQVIVALHTGHKEKKWLILQN